MKNIQSPLVHLNGTGKDSLADAYCDAYSAVGDAMDALRKTAPNARDYYPLGDGAMKLAEQQHRERMLALHNLRLELEALANSLDGETTTVPVEVAC